MLEIDNLNQNKWKKEYVDILLSFSGGKDSTVLFDLVLKTYKEIRNQFISKIFIVPGYAYEITFPETIKFIKNYVENIRNIDGNDFVKELIFEKPKLPWEKILNDKGFPIYSKQFSVILNRIKKVKSKNGLTNWIFKINTSRFSISYDRLFLLDNDMKKFKIDASIDKQYFGETLKKSNYLYSEKCCDYIKGGLKHIKLPSFVGTMASESNLRKMSWINYGCNIITEKKLCSRPLSIWNEKDIWKYIIRNHVEINKMYGFDKNKLDNELDDEQINSMIKTLNYKRLGCISCPYGSHLEKDINRFEILYKQNLLLYESQVIKNGMYKILIDMNIKIPCDTKYMQLYELRQKQKNEWYEKIHENIFKIISQIENYKDYKNYHLLKRYQNKNVAWTYNDDEISTILNNYKIKNKNNLDFTLNEIKQKINKYRNKLLKNKHRF